MKVVHLKDDERAYFLDLDPLHMMRRADLAGGFILGALEEAENGTEDTPAGLLICARMEDMLWIIWMYVLPEYRMQGIGDALLERVARMAEGGGIPRIGAYFCDVDGRAAVCPGDEGYFREHGFQEELPLLGEWHSDARTLLGSPFFKETGDDGKVPHAVPLRQLPGGLVRRSISELVVARQNVQFRRSIPMLPVVTNMNALDLDVSTVVLGKDGKPLAVMLVACLEETMYPVALLSTSRRMARALFQAFLEQSIQKYGPAARVEVILAGERNLELAKEILDATSGGMEKDAGAEKPVARKVESRLLLTQTASLRHTGIGVYQPQAGLPEDRDSGEAAIALLAHREAGQEDEVRRMDLAQVLAMPLPGGKAKAAGAEPVGALEVHEFYEGLWDCQYYEHLGLLSDERGQIGQIPLDWFELDLSCCVRVDGKMLGLFLISVSDEGELVPILLFASGRDAGSHLLQMIHFAVYAAEEKYPPETQVVLHLRDAAVKALAKKLIG